MSESHAADSPADIERAEREAEEFRTRLGAAVELVERMDQHLKKKGVCIPGSVELTPKETDLLVWYVRQLQAGHRSVNHLLFNHITDMQHLKRSIVHLF